MSLKISTHKGHRITSQMLNDRVTDVVGGNALLSGFEVIKASNTMLEITPGKCIIDGAIIEETSSNPCQIGFHSSWGTYSSMFVIMRYTHNECNAEILIRCKKDMIDRDLVLAEVFCTSTQIEKVIQTPYVKNLKEINEIAVKVEGVGATPVSNEVSGKVVKADNTFAGNIENLNIKGQTYQNLVDEDNMERPVLGELVTEEDTLLTIENSNAGKVNMRVKGKTLQNLFVNCNDSNCLNNYRHWNVVGENTFEVEADGTNKYLFIKKENMLLKPSTEYTFILEVLENTLIGSDEADYTFTIFGSSGALSGSIVLTKDKLQTTMFLKTTIPNLDSAAHGFDSYLNNKAIGGKLKIRLAILEGNYTDTPIEEIPYIEGIAGVGDKSVNLFSGYEQLIDVRGKGTEFSIHSEQTEGCTRILMYLYDEEGTLIEEDIIAKGLGANHFYYVNNADHRYNTTNDQEKLDRKVIFSRPVGFIKFSTGLPQWNIKQYRNVQLEVGTIATEYQPYGTHKIKVLSCGKNLFNPIVSNRITSITTNTNYLISDDGYTISISSNHNKPDVDSVSHVHFGEIKLRVGETYEVLVDEIIRDTSNSSPQIRIAYWDESDNRYASIGYLTNQNSSFSFTVKKGQERIALGLYAHGASLTNGEVIKATYKGVRIYQAPVLSTAYKAFKWDASQILLDEPLMSLPNGACDEIVDGKLIKRVGKTVLDGSENWSYHNSNSDTISTYIYWLAMDGFDRKLSGDNAICDNVVVGKNSEYTSIGFVTSGFCYLNVLKTTLDNNGDVISLKSYLAQNPITVYYELAEPVITELSDLILSTFDEITYISSSTKLPPKLQVDSKGTKYKVPLLKPSTKYTVKASTDMNATLGGATGQITNGEAKIITPAEIQDNTLCLSGWGKVARDVMVFEGEADYHEYIDGIKGVGDKSRNLFNGELELGGYTGSAGTPFVDSARVRTKTKILLSSGDYVVSSEESTLISACEYNVDGTFIREHYANSNNKYFKLEGDRLVHFQMINPNLLNSKIQLEKGATPTEYQPPNTHKIEILSHGSNICDKRYEYKNYSFGGVTINSTKDTVMVDGTIDTDGGDIYFSPTSADKKISLKPNTTYCAKVFVISGKVYKNNIEQTSLLANVKLLKKDNTVSRWTHGKFTTTDEEDGLTHLRITCLAGDEWRFENFVFAISLTETTDYVDYQPYQESRMQILLDEPLMSLPNGVCDEIVGNKLIRRVGKLVLDGSEYWNVTGYGGHETRNTFECTIAVNPTGQNVSRPVCSYSNNFLWENTIRMPHEDNSYRISHSENENGSKYYCLFCPSVDMIPYRDSNLWKKWLSENPTTIYYELAEPIIEELPLQRPLQSFDEVTHISATTNILPMLSLTLPNLAKAINQNSGRLSELEDIIDNIIIPGLVDTDYRNMLFGFDYSMDRLLLK